MNPLRRSAIGIALGLWSLTAASATAAVTGLDHFTVTPCRLFDSRLGDPPALANATPRLITVAGHCGIPASATDVALNVTVVDAAGDGHLKVYDPDSPPPGTSVINFRAHRTRANNAIVKLSASGQIAALPTVIGGGTLHLVVDTAGYFASSVVANDDTATVSEDAAATTIDVRANDSNPDALSFSIASVTQPAHGTVVITNGGADLTYQPNTNYCNNPPGTTPDTFTYTLTPGGSTATVSVTVTCAPPPTVTSTVPANGDTNVAPNATVTINFNKTVNVTGSAFKLECPTGTPTAFTVTPASPASSFVLHPSANLPGGVTCTVTVVANQVTDLDVGRHLAADYTTSFTVDQPPTVSTVVPANAATTVPLSTTVTVNFSEQVNVTGSAFKLECPAGTPVAFTVSPASPATSFVLHPTANLPGGTICKVTVVASQVTDVDFGQNMAADFTSSFTTDVPPTVASTVPANGAGAAVTSTVSITFSEQVNVTGSAFTLECPTGTPVAFTVTPASPATTFVLHPTSNLPGGVTCTATVVANQVADTDAGSQMAANFVFSFDVSAVAVDDAALRTEDDPATAIDVLANDIDGGTKSIASVTQPANGTVVITGGGTGLTYQNVANYCNATFTPLDLYHLGEGDGGATAGNPVSSTVDAAGSFNLTAQGNPTYSATVPPGIGSTLAVHFDGSGDALTSANLATTAVDDFGIEAWVKADSAAIADSIIAYNGSPTTSGWGLAVAGGNYVAQFGGVTTATAAPVTTAWTHLVLIRRSGVTSVYVNGTRTATTSAVPNAPALASGGGLMIGGDLAGGQSFGGTIDEVRFFTLTGSAPDTFTYTLASGGSTATVSVTVECIDDPPVAVNDSATVAENAGATAIDVLANDTDPDGGPKSIKSVTQPAHGTVVITGGGTGLTYQPAANYCNSISGPADTFTYTLTPGGSTATVSVTVTCAPPPTVTSTAPANGATNVALNTTVTINFNKPVNVTGSAFKLECPAGTPKAFTVTPASPASSFVLHPSANLPGGVTCTVTVVANQVTELDAGRHLAADYVTTFTTDQPPTVSTVVPANGAVNVINTSTVTINFSESVNVTGTAFKLECPTGTPVAFTVTPASPASSFVLHPSAKLPAGAVCTVTVVASQVTDVDFGQNMPADFTSTFTVDVPPSVASTVPANGAISVSPASAVTVNFSESVNVTGSSFKLECPAGTPVAFTITPASPATSFVLHPTANLPADTTCTATVVAAQVTDVDAGSQMLADFVFSFSVPPIAVADNNLSNPYPHSVIGHVSIDSSLVSYKVTTNDLIVNPVTITAFDATTAHGGTVSMTTSGAGLGQFTYNPPVGYTGPDTFTYTITNAHGSSTATVSLTVSGLIWFIDNNASAGDGRLSSPLNSLAAFQAINDGAAGHGAANHNIFLYESSTNYTGPVTLLAGQKLIGQDATASLSAITGLTPGASSAALPATNSGNATIVRITSAGNTVTLGSNNTVRGLTLGNSTGIALTGTSVGTLTLRDLTINTTGSALSVTTGTLDAILTKVSSASGTHGIALTGTTGSLEVTGDGASDPANTTRGRTTAKNGGGTITLGSGGTLSGATSAGVLLSNAANVTLRNMTIQGNGSGINTGGDGITASGGTSGLTLDNVLITGQAGNHGLHGTTVSNVTLQHTEISANATSSGVETNHVWDVRFDDLTGTGSFLNSLFFNSRENIVGLSEGSINANATLSLTITNSEFRDTATSSPGNDGLSINALGSSNVTANITGSSFTHVFANGFQYTGNASSGGGTITVASSTFDNEGTAINIAHQGLGKTLTFDINGNFVNQTVGGRNTAINLFLAGSSNATTLFQGKVRNNTVGNNAVAGSGSSLGKGIDLFASGAGTLTARVDSNTVRQIHQDTAFRAASVTHTGQINVTVTNNDFESQTSGLGLDGIDLTAGGVAGDTGTLCAHLFSNVAAIGDASAGGVGIFASTQAGTPTMNLEGYSGAANNTTQINAFLNTTATTVSPAASSFVGAGTIKAAPSPCPTPP
jgi:methionine-rich copper-binding protein CopC